MANKDIKLKFIIVCDKAEIGENNKLDIKGVFDTINAVDFPTIHKFMSVVASVELNRGEYREELKIKGINGPEITLATTDIVKEENGSHRFIHNLLDINFLVAGIYAFNVYIDNVLIGSTKLILKKIQ